MAATTVRGMWCVAAGDAAAAAGFGTGGAGGAGGVYIDCGGPAWPGGPAGADGAAGSAWIDAHMLANWRAGAAWSNRLRHRGHHEGSPASRAPQFGHSLTRTVSAVRSPKLRASWASSGRGVAPIPEG
jgi:hypothetical protein